MSDLDWHGDEALDHCKERAVGFLNRAAITVRRRAAELLSVAGTAVRRMAGRGKRKGSRIYGAVVSQPGEPPRKQTGNLRRSVAYEVDPESLRARVGTPWKYGKYLELGTKRGLAPRPWLRRALDEMRSKVNEFLDEINQGGT